MTVLTADSKRGSSLDARYILPFQELTKTHFRLCMKDYAGHDGQRSTVVVDYLIIGGNYRMCFFLMLWVTNWS